MHILCIGSILTYGDRCHCSKDGLLITSRLLVTNSTACLSYHIFKFPSINLATYLWKSTSANLLQPSGPSKSVSVFYNTVTSTNMQAVICGRFSFVYCTSIVDFSPNTLSCSPAAFIRRVTVRRGCYEVLVWLGELGRKRLSKQVRCVTLTIGFRGFTAFW
jgi:hypothetical protein